MWTGTERLMLRAPCHVLGGNGWSCGRWRAGSGAIFGRSLPCRGSRYMHRRNNGGIKIYIFSFGNSEMIGCGLFSIFFREGRARFHG